MVAKRAASVLSISAARDWSRLTVGSSPYTSSPTSAWAMTSRMAGVGLVTVSLRRSMILVGSAIGCLAPRQNDPGIGDHAPLPFGIKDQGVDVELGNLRVVGDH